jgi:hypothetical protein
MPLNLRASKNLNNFNVPVSYRVHDNSGKFLDARNVNSIQDRLDTRFGTSRYNAVALGGSVQSLSSFIKADGTQYLIAKIGTELISVSATGAHTVIKTGLSALTVHRGVTGNDRHIIAIGSDGLFSWNGTIFTQLGQAAPSVPTLAEAASGDLVATNIYQVAISFYASSIGFESNYSESLPFTLTGANKTLDVSAIPATADNALIDTVYIYLKNVTTDGAYLYVSEVALGATTFQITAESTSSDTPETTHDIPNKDASPEGSGGGKYLTNFNSKLVFTGNASRPNEVYFSETDLPDAFNSLDTATRIPVPGQGPVTGLAVGLFGDSVLDPFLVIFKGKSTRIYSEIGDQPKMVVLSEEIGCVSHDTITVKNGVVYFLSEEGWRAIAGGRFVTDKSGEAITLSNGDIDDIFRTSGYTYEVNRNGMARTFSVYYPTLDQYITWVSEGANNAYTKAYVYEFDIGGFKPYEFAVDATCAVLGETSSGRDQVLFGTSNGYILKHSIAEARSDVDSANTVTAINAFAVLPWMPEDGDFDATYSFRELILKAITSQYDLTVKTYIDYNLATVESKDYDFTDSADGFTLDEDELDVGVLSDGRKIVPSRGDINRVGETIAIGFYQSIIDANIGLISMQVDSNKNGNRNKGTDNDDDAAVFDAETGTYFLSPSEAAELCASYLQQIQQLAATIAGSVAISYSGWSDRFDEIFVSTDLEDTLDKILIITYAAPTITLSCSPSQAVREKGTSVASVDMSATTTKRSDPITAVLHYRNGVLVNTEASPDPDGAVETYTESTPFTDTMTFYSTVNDGTTLVQSNTVTYVYAYPYYSGAGAVGLSAANVALLTKNVRVSTASLNKSFTTLNGEVYFFAYPASYGALTSILDENGFETFSDWTLRTENITGLDATPVSYRIYEFNNPVVAGSTDFTFIR